MLAYRLLKRFRFSTITHLSGKSEFKEDNKVELRGIKIQSTQHDSPNLIFLPEIFDQAENWIRFFSNPDNKVLVIVTQIIQQRNVYIVYPRNFGNSDKNPQMSWQSHANDIHRFMYNNKISMATLAGHGLGGKIAFATACYHFDYVTGYFGIDTTPMNQFYFQPFHELRDYIKSLINVRLDRPFDKISLELKKLIQCPKWRKVFQSNIIRQDKTYAWKFNLQAIWDNVKDNTPGSLMSWSSLVGLYPGRVAWAFPDESRYVYLNTNTFPMLKLCPHCKGFNHDIFSIQGDIGIQNHWVYELQDEINPYAYRMSQFLTHFDGVHVLLLNRDQVGRVYLPEMNCAKNPNPLIPGDYIPAHYYHGWRFNNIYAKQKQLPNN